MAPATPTTEPQLGDPTADASTALGASRWMGVARRAAVKAKGDHLTLLAAGVAFYLLIATVPATGAVVSLYALFADPATVAEDLAGLLGAAPAEVTSLVTDAATRVARTSTGSATVAAVVSVAAALWAASSWVVNLIEAVGVAYGEPARRSFAAKRALAVAFTVAGAVFGVVAVTSITAAPALADAAGVGSAGRWAVSVGRWPLLAAGWMAALAALYRYAPERTNATWRWVTPGAVFSTVVWLAASAAFSVYVANFGSYNEAYGALGGVVVAMLWLFITAVAVLAGAELNCEAERATAAGTATGASRSSGRRGAYAADTYAGSPTQRSTAASGERSGPGSWAAVMVVAVGWAVAAVSSRAVTRRGRPQR